MSTVRRYTEESIACNGANRTAFHQEKAPDLVWISGARILHPTIPKQIEGFDQF